MNRFFTALLLAGLACSALVSGASVAKPTCGGSSSSKSIQLLTPTNPPRECVYHINAYSSYVCQLRIDFAMTLGQPTVPAADNDLTYAKCENDYFAIGDLHLCGTETSQHIYVPFNRTAGVTSIDLSIVLANRAGWTGLPTPSWDMMVTQLECPSGAAIRALEFAATPEDIAPSMRASFKDGFFVAPPGCLQYFPQAQGTFSSFNYPNVYPGNMNYAICFRRQTSTKALDLQALGFRLGSDYTSIKARQMDSFCYSQVRSSTQNEDYLMIPQAFDEQTEVHATYFCGDSIAGASIRSTNPGPLMVLFNSDATYSIDETGFSFSYEVL